MEVEGGTTKRGGALLAYGVISIVTTGHDVVSAVAVLDGMGSVLSALGDENLQPGKGAPSMWNITL
jgi:hypothetical protein